MNKLALLQLLLLCLLFSRRVDVCIDPGHGGTAYLGGSSAYGAVNGNFLDGPYEKNFDLEIAWIMADDLYWGLGYTVSMTRTGDWNVSLKDRTKMANGTLENPYSGIKDTCEYFVSVHNNGSTDHTMHGTLTLYYKSADEEYANCIHSNMYNYISNFPWADDLEVRQEFKYVIGNTDSPACITESAYVSHDITFNAQWYQLRDNQGSFKNKVAWGIDNGIDIYYEFPKVWWLRIRLDAGSPGIDLIWSPGPGKSVTGYNIYRKTHPDDEYVLLENNFPDTIYTDNNVSAGNIYSYYVKGVDGGQEGNRSNIVTAQVPPFSSDFSMATGLNTGKKVIFNDNGISHITWTNLESIWYSQSTDYGNTWSVAQNIDYGWQPAIATNSSEKINISYISTLGVPDSAAQETLSYTINYAWHENDFWYDEVLYETHDSILAVSFVVDPLDTGWVIFNAYDDGGNNYLKIGQFYTQIMPESLENVITLDTYTGTGIASVGVKSSDRSLHLVYEKDGQITYLQRDDLGNWSAPFTVSDGHNPCLSIADDLIHLIWETWDAYTDIVTCYTDGTTWSDIDTITSEVTGQGCFPYIEKGSVAVWSELDNSQWEVFSSNCIEEDDWTTPQNISQTSADSKYPQVAMYQTGFEIRLIYIWTEGNASPFEVKIYSSSFTPSGYVLNLDSFPMYEAEEPHDQMCGPAVAQMALNYMFWNRLTHPDSVPMLPEFAQDLLYEYGIAHNSDPELDFFDLQGMWHTIQDKKPMPYSEYGYNFTKRHNTDQYTMLKLICQWIDYTVGTYGGHKDGHPYHVPSIVPAYGNYTNWMAVRGIHTDVAAYPMPDTLIIYGFWVNDPYPASMGGIGENSYKIISDWNSTYYLSMTVGDYVGEYLAVLEPPESAEDCHLILAEPIPRFSPMQMNQLSIMTDRSIIQGDINQWIIQAAINGVTEHLIPYDKKFAELFAMTSPSKPLFAQSMNGNDYYIVPFRLNNPMPKITKGKAIKEVKITTKVKTNSDVKDKSKIEPLYAKGTDRADAISEARFSAQVRTLRLTKPILIETKDKIAVVIFIDANDGSFKEASWTENPVTYLPISREQAQQIAFEVATEELGLEIDDINDLQPELIHRKSTPYYPQWRIIIEEYAIYIGQDGSVCIEEFVAGGQGNSGVMSEDEAPSFVYSLNTAAPSPFVKNTTISYSIAKPDEVSLNIYDISGRLIKTLVDGRKDAGIYSVKWDGYDNNNQAVANGVYFTRLTSGNFTLVKKVILVR